MKDSASEVVLDALAKKLTELISELRDAHCMRLDDFPADDAAALVRSLGSTHAEAVDVLVLSAAPDGAGEVSAERAIELRNRKIRPLMLLVPHGQAAAASSLDNSFERIPHADLLQDIADSMLLKLRGTDVDPVLRTLGAIGKRRSQIGAWTEFLASLSIAPSLDTFGRELWRIGLIPDLGKDAETRLAANLRIAPAISEPRRPTLTVSARLSTAGVREHPTRLRIQSFLESQGLLHDARAWCRAILDADRELTFEKWPLVEQVESSLVSVKLVPFVDADGKLDSKCKLKQGEDGQLQCIIPADGAGKVVLRWETEPARVDTVARWIADVLPPSDLRSADAVALGSSRVKGSARQAAISIEVEDEDDVLSDGVRFVVRLTAESADGQLLQLSSGEEIDFESEEFEVVVALEPEEPKERSAKSRSVAEAVLKATLEGLQDHSEDQGSFDFGGQVFSLRVGGRRRLQIPISTVLTELHRKVLAHPAEASAFYATSYSGEPLASADFERRGSELPRALAERRQAVLQLLAGATPRDTPETVSWTQELRDAVSQYLGTYRRALDAAGSDGRATLLAMDTVTIDAALANRVTRGVVVLPVHPLRLAWLAQHDATLRAWLPAISDLPKSTRAGMVDVRAIARITPANLPFTLLDWDDNTVVYYDELTHGTGLYLPADAFTQDVDAALVASLISTQRYSAVSTISSLQVADRLDSYRLGHPGGSALRLLAVEPSDGRLLAGAIAKQMQMVDTELDPIRIEAIAYTDHSSYLKPLGELQTLQQQVRNESRTRAMSHLAPPLALAQRSRSRLLNDDTEAHVAVLQSAAAVELTSTVGADDRAPSLDGLLTPTITQLVELRGRLTSLTAPALRTRPGQGDADIAAAHRVHQLALGRHSSGQDVFPALGVAINAEMQAVLSTLHARCDWVVTIDRHLGVAALEAELDNNVPGAQILDYVPDFIDGIGDRLTVTTSRRHEVERIIEGAMQEMGLAAAGRDAADVLKSLSAVSGRLALRLIGDNTFARESVSLAALMTHLGDRKELEGTIVVPVDSHPEIFGAIGRKDEASAQRCDLLLVRVTQRSFKIDCVEVKSRSTAKLPAALADQIVDQLQATERLLTSRFFSADPARPDAPLQRARLASLLHYYADRSALYGSIEADKLADVHKFIDRIENSSENPEIALRGFVVSLDGDAGYPRKVRDVPIVVLTAAELGRIGFTTMYEFKNRNRVISDVLPGSDAEGQSASPAADADAGGASLRESVALSSVDTPAPILDMTEPADDADVTPEHATTAGESGDDARPEPSGSMLTAERPALTASAHCEETLPARGEGVEEIEVSLGKDAQGRDVTWAISTKGSPHAFVLGIPGQGKSVTTRKIIRDFSAGGLPSLVFDFHGDMAANPPEGAEVCDATEGLPFHPFELRGDSATPAAHASWEIAEILQVVCSLGEIQRNHVYQALTEAYRRHGWQGTDAGEALPSISEFAAQLAEVEKAGTAKNTLARLTPITDFGLFRDEAVGAFEPWKTGGMVVDLSNLGLEQVQLAAGSFILRQLYNQMFSWPQDGTMKLAIVLDEAHRLAKDVTLPKLMKEGRKYGISVIVASQGLDDFRSQVIDNAGTKIVFRTNFPASKKVAGLLRGRGAQDLSEQIEQLGVGQAYVSTPDIAQARKVYMFE